MCSIKKYGVLLVVLVMMGCSQKTPSEYIDEAEKAILQNDTESAVIVLKNALSSDPKNLRARFLLGSVYFQRGNSESAEKELKIAFEGGYFKNEVLPLYLGTLNFLHRDDEIIQEVERLTGLTSETEAIAQMYKGLALFRKNEVSRAKLAIKRATELYPDSSYSRLGRAHHALNDGEVTDALIILEELLADDPKFMEAVLLQGQLSMQQQDYATAIKDFTEYVAQKPGDAQGNFLLIDALLRDEQYDKAESLTVDLLKKLPDNPKLNEFIGIVQFHNKDYSAAKTSMEQAISSGSNSPTSRLIAGVSSYNLQKLEQAHNHLAAVQSVLPQSHPAKRLFAEIQLRLGYSTDAAQTLGGMGNYNLNDVTLFTQAGFDLIKSGDNSKAKEMLELAKKSVPNNAEELTRIGILKLSLEDRSGKDNLIKAIKLDPEVETARLFLAQAYLGDEDFESAANVAKEWIAFDPEQVTAYNLLAEIYEISGQTVLAKQTHNDILKRAPHNPASLKFFADEANSNGKPEEALSLLKSAAENNPEYVQGTFDYLVQAIMQGDQEAIEAFSLIESIYEKQPDDLMKKLNYARALILHRKPQQALTILESIEPIKDMPLFFWKGQADSYLALDKPKDALNVYSRWQQLEPNRREPWLAAVHINDKIKDFSSALDTVKRALSFHNEDGEFRVMEVHYSLAIGKVLVAQRLLTNLPEKVKSNSIVKGLEGQIYFAQKDFKNAIPLLESAYDASLDGRMALLIADAKLNLNQVSDSFAVLEKHLVKVPTDLNTRAFLAERYMDSMPEKAIFHYEIVLKSLPENFMVLNNLSWLHGITGETSKAVKYAESAVVLRPQNPKLLDTLGVALLKNGNVEKAIEVSKKAFDLEPSNQTYRIHYEEAQKSQL
ncbi:PEP-CTERM system TPR-repeat protein PrsT [Aliiglaciecola sp. 3_MG-2023]|uniref:XrtA/PEP-CTERM system TPR-repeat protein PrsT n=1 Tax=Aliiglaciecola sp. 3_MG-2023 TaxID=3062644 RepID=UPI0026E230F8|nr:XrtA/PEP-CTERM system TPR-repeat protein PrsT [Aliiglaciecola sp. 3_MG-2023]MDO6694012.1 PEP-CTERM system TPR-repeat protein PrsT [Aliiglaciecola sp. 3_MG-2023]